jgi:dihydrodipicolinate synthase/N-acetylneuraminate lyase
MDLPDAPGMFEYYRALSEAVSIPIIIQDTPASGHLLTAPAMWRLYQELDNVCYAKVESERFLAKTAELQALSRGDLHLIGGAAGKHLIHMLRAGVTAFMTGTEALDIHAAVVNAYLGGDEEQAARIYFERLLPYLMFYLDYPRELLKAMLHRRGIIACPKVIPPPAGAPMSDVERREFEWILDRIGWSDDRPGSA